MSIIIATQDPKYGIEVIFTDGMTNVEARLVNISTGKPIPEDEPIFMFRAQDMLASQTIAHYRHLVATSEHRDAVLQREKAFIDFSRKFPDRMKVPDTIFPFIEVGK